ncbi:MAG TPA: hypothetical protein VH740_06380 [Vicinamibacterales bacterium]|jgi:hypothetical protein
MIDGVLTLGSGAGRREAQLDTYLDASTEERTTEAAIQWIKALRHARVDGHSFRDRFTYRGDSLWWFAEIYLHKQQVVLGLLQTIAALDALIDRERPSSLELVRGGRIVRGVAPQIAAARKIDYRGPTGFGRSAPVAVAALDARASALHAAAMASRLRGKQARGDRRGVDALAFVHRAFWNADVGDGSAEAYIGPVLNALEERLGVDKIAYVSVGPAENFRARRWWHPLRPGTSAGAAAPVEAFSGVGDLAPSRQLWRDRHRLRRALWNSADIRQRAVVGAIDCWPIVQEELAGIALLQWPWSARAMDEAGAALDALGPRVAVTYAEAGGWGRAMVIECRRRGIASVGLQHGFIYRHWLNYLHAPDEMIASSAHSDDRGFPTPTATLLFDDYAAHHLKSSGHFPDHAIEVTGSPRLDALALGAQRVTDRDVDRARTMAGGGETLVLVTAKHREAHRVLGPFLDAAGSIDGVRVAIKTHPAETPDVYATLAANRSYVRVLDASAPLAPLLRASRAVVTVNSTVALDAAVLDVPALVIGLPNNLTPFVDAGVMAGVNGADAGETARALGRILYDEEFRRELALARRAFLTRFKIHADGRAAERAAGAIVRLAAAARA